MRPYRVNAKRQSGLTVSPFCEACKRGTHFIVPDDWFKDNPKTVHQRVENYIKETLGYVRRFFAPGVNVWFCSEKCAYDSPRAKEIESYWLK